MSHLEEKHKKKQLELKEIKASPCASSYKKHTLPNNRRTTTKLLLETKTGRLGVRVDGVAKPLALKPANLTAAPAARRPPPVRNSLPSASEPRSGVARCTCSQEHKIFPR